MKKVVQDLTSAGIDWQREKWQSGLGSKFIHQGEKNAAKYADEVIVLSKGVQKYFMETYGRETHFIPNGVNRPQIREASLITDKFGLKKDSYILFLGRLVPEKGIRYLVEAFKNVKTDKKLVIAGGSSDTDSFMEELKDLAKGDDRILFTGFVQGAISEKDLWNCINQELHQRLEEHKNLKKLIQKNSGKSKLQSKEIAIKREIEQLSGSIVRLESQKRSGYEQCVLGKISKEKFLELKQSMENEIVTLKQTKAEKEKELAVVQEELQQKKQIAGSTEVLLTADNLQQYVKKIEVDRRKITCTEFVF